MRDILFPLVVVAFFALATLLVDACDRLIAPGSSEAGGCETSPK